MHRRSKVLLAVGPLSLALAAPTPAHQVVDQPNLGRLIVSSPIIVRGTIGRASRAERGSLLASLRIEKVLKGEVAAAEISFASDPDHGIDYASGERVLLFLLSAPPGSPAPFTSPQVFGMRYPITSFDPTGYDGLVAGLLAAEKETGEPARSCKRKEVLLGQLSSHERKVRLYAASALSVENEARTTRDAASAPDLSCATPRP